MEDVHVRALEKKQYLSKKPASRFASAGLAVSGNKSFLILISRICQILEFFIRYLFVNIPTFVLASFPEINRISILCITYFLMQVMGICWAVLVNAGFALACRVTYILPEIRLDVASKLRISADVAGFSPSATSEVMASFYVFYASIRIMITFAQNVFTIALQSTQDFPDASKQIARGGMSSLTLTRAAFFPAIMLQLGLICADTVCMDIGDEDGVLATETLLSFQAVSQLRSKICEHFGFNFFTSPYANVRNLIFAVVLIMVLQTWQAYLQQFPRWNPVFQNMSSGARFGFQFSATILLLSTLTTLFAMCTDFIHGVIAERAVLLNMLGWTVWLMQFSSVLTENRGPEWIQTLTPKHIQHMLSYLRMSQCLLLIAMFAYKTLVYGLLQAQSELTFITLLLPALYCMVYLGSTALLNVQNDMRMLWSGVCFSFLTSVVITYGIAKTNAKGSLLMVFLHVMKKWVEMFEAVIASDADDYDLRGEYCDVAAVSDGPIPTDSLPATANSMCGNDSSTRGRPRLSSVPKEGNDASDRPSLLQSGVHQSPKKLFSFAKVQSGSACNSSPVRDFRQSPLSLPPLLSPSSSRSLKTAHRSRSFSALSQNVDGSIAQTPGKASPEDAQPRAVRRVSSASLLTGLDDSDSSDAVHGNRERALSITTRLLHERGQVNNPLVSLGIPDHVRKHWLLAVPKQNMTYLGNLSSWMTGGYVGNNPYAGTVRAFINLAMSLIVFLMVITVLATAQRSLSVYPKLLKFNLHSDVDASGQVQHYLHFDHKVSNVTLQLHPHTADLIYERAESVPSPRHHTCHHDCDVIGEEDSWNGHEVLGRFSNQRSFSHYEMQRELPYYMSCSWRWKGLSVLDFALLSQVAYFEDENHSLHGDGLDEIPSGARTFRVQQIVDALFPHDDFVATLSHANSSDVGPRFVEVHSDKLNLTIVAVRGTDVGRLSDIMEDFKLFAEPIIFKCLSTVFPTIRMWSHDTTSQVIEWLFEFNSFFGLQGESEYYRALSQRVLHLAEHYGNRDAESVNPTASLGKYREQVPAAPAQSCSSSSSVPLSNNISLETPKSTASPVRPAMQPQPHHLVITGHSLGGGLARIVGALTGQASVSFGPPGLGLSYRKYSIENAHASKLKSGHTIKISSKGQLDHQSLAIVTAFDVVTQIDQQVGLIQNIQCDHQDKAFHNAACHLLEGTICHLLKHCGDAKNRFVTCDSKFDVAVLGPSISAFLWHYKYLTVPLVLMVICFVLLAVIPAVV